MIMKDVASAYITRWNFVLGAIFVAIVLNRVPLDTLVIELGSNRNAIYKMLFDARRKLRAALAANGYIDPDESRPS